MKSTRKQFRTRAGGLTLVEVIIALAVVGLLMAAVMSQMLESVSLGLKAAGTLEHSRSTRELILRLSEDTRNAQQMIIHTTFADRSSPRRDGQLGNYLVLHQINSSGSVVRTIGYYTVPLSGGNGWMLHRHDSADGLTSPGTLPASGTSGSHRVVTRAVNLPESSNLFRSVRDRAVAIRGEFGSAGNARIGRTEFVQCILSTRS